MADGRDVPEMGPSRKSGLGDSHLCRLGGECGNGGLLTGGSHTWRPSTLNGEHATAV